MGRLTIVLPDDLHEALRRRALLEGRTLKAMSLRALRVYIRLGSPKLAAENPSLAQELADLLR